MASGQIVGRSCHSTSGIVETEVLHPHCHLRSDGYHSVQLQVHLIANVANSLTYRDAVVRLQLLDL